MATPFDIHRCHVRPAAAITNGQANYLRDLMAQKAELLGKPALDAERQVDAWLLTLSREGASAQIEKQKDALAQLRADANASAAITVDRLASRAESDRISGTPGADIVPAGRYAIDTDDGATNVTAFYRVDRPTEGRWAGRVFVKLIISDDEQRLSWPVTKTVLRKIAEVGAINASARYGHEIGECGICGRTLTNDDSRARGIGPVCAAKAGW